MTNNQIIQPSQECMAPRALVHEKPSKDMSSQGIAVWHHAARVLGDTWDGAGSCPHNVGKHYKLLNVPQPALGVYDTIPVTNPFPRGKGPVGRHALANAWNRLRDSLPDSCSSSLACSKVSALSPALTLTVRPQDASKQLLPCKA